MRALRDYERALGERLLAGLPAGVTALRPAGMDGRVPTFLLNLDGVPAEPRRSPARRARHRRLVRRQLVLRRARDRLPPQSLRVGLVHYNSADEVDRFCEELARIRD